MRLAFSIAAAMLTLACGGKAVVDAVGAGGSGGAGGTAQTCTSLVPCCDTQTNVDVDFQCDANNMPFCPSGSAFSQTGTCAFSASCIEPADCSGDQWCDFPDNQCGTGAVGTCRDRPNNCTDFFRATCLCTGEIASNPCEGEANGSDASVIGSCPTPLDLFACGDTFCFVGTQYCRRDVSDVVGEPDLYSCRSPSGPCIDEVDCQCVANEPCGNTCTGPPGEVRVTCPGG